MAVTERVAVARFQKPIELSIRRRPEHEIEHGLGSDRIVSSQISIGGSPMPASLSFWLGTGN
jgi:hypothetical protein